MTSYQLYLADLEIAMVSLWCKNQNIYNSEGIPRILWMWGVFYHRVYPETGVDLLMKKRVKKETKKLAVVLAAGIAYYLWILLTDLRFPCIFNLITGLLCPGCGVTRMIVALLRFDFASAYGYNKFLFVTSPLLLFLWVYSEWNYIKKGERDIGRLNVVLYIEGVMMFVFGIVRNII